MDTDLPKGWFAEPAEGGRIRIWRPTLLHNTSNIGYVVVPALLIGLCSGCLAYGLADAPYVLPGYVVLLWILCGISVLVMSGSLFYNLTLKQDFHVGKNNLAVRNVWFGKVDTEGYMTGSRLRIHAAFHKGSNGGGFWRRHLTVECGSRSSIIATAQHPVMDGYGLDELLADAADDAPAQIGQFLAEQTRWELSDIGADVMRLAYSE